jgi:hypothetical protein
MRINVWSYRYVKGYPLFSGVNSSRRGNPSRYFEADPSGVSTVVDKLEGEVEVFALE